MSIELLRKRLSADRASFIEPCMPPLTTTLRPAQIGFTRSSTMGFGLWPGATRWASGSSPARATTGPPATRSWVNRLKVRSCLIDGEVVQNSSIRDCRADHRGSCIHRTGDTLNKADEYRAKAQECDERAAQSIPYQATNDGNCAKVDHGRALLVAQDRAHRQQDVSDTYEARTGWMCSIASGRFYNSKRRHSTIGYLSSMEFERKAGFA